MEQHETIQKLNNGICELIYTDQSSVECSLMGTLAPQHLPDNILSECLDLLNNENKAGVALSIFDVNGEKCTSIFWDSLIDVEQLTGEGAECNRAKLRPSGEYFEQLALFPESDEDLEYPEPCLEEDLLD